MRKGILIAIFGSLWGLADALHTSATPGPATQIPQPSISRQGPGGFELVIELPAARLERVLRAAGPCIEPRWPVPAGGDWSPASEHPGYGWLIGIPNPGGARIETLALEAEPASARALDEPLCDADPLREPPRRRLQLGRSLSDGPEGPILREAGGLRSAASASATWDAAAPGVWLEEAGSLRGQALGRIRVQPYERNADGSLLIRRSLQLRLRYAQPETVRRAEPQDGPFRLLAAELLNAGWLPRRSEDRAGRPGAISAPSGLDQGEPGWDWTAPGDALALKLSVDRDAAIEIRGRDLAEAGWDLASMEPSDIRLEHGSGIRPLSIEDGGDGSLDPEDRLRFQGRAQRGDFTRSNVYWLRPQGGGSQAKVRSVRPAPALSSDHFTETLRFETDSQYYVSMRAQDGDDRWMWDVPLSAPESVLRTLHVPNLLQPAAAARLRVRLQGNSQDFGVQPDHHLQVQLNGQLLGATRFDGLVWHEVSLAIPAGLLREGDNELDLLAVGDTGASIDQVYLNWIELDYRAGYRLQDGSLDFGAVASGERSFRIDGLVEGAWELWDIREPERPIRLEGAELEPSGPDRYALRFTDDAAEDARYRLYQAQGVSPPSSIEPNATSGLRDTEQGADYIVISHPRFLEALGPLVADRQAQGMRTQLVDVVDVYDEFSGGVFDPHAIRDFLKYAYVHWQRPAPRYVLLVGEATLDYRDNYGRGYRSFMPSMQMELNIGGEAAAIMSDLWFANLDEDLRDPVPELLLGRLSVSTADQTRRMVDKILRYERQALDEPWRRRIVMVADDDGATAFEAFTEDLIARLPAGHSARRFYAGSYPREADLRGDIATAVEDGALILNFTGHGNVALWSPWPGGGRIFENRDIGGLQNGDAMPLFTSATCMNGWIDHPLRDVSMSEAWLINPDGGGAVAWSPAGFTFLGPQRVLFGTLFDGLYDGLGLPIAGLTAQASLRAHAQNSGWADIVRMFTLLGDPATLVSGVELLPSPTPTPRPSPTPTPAPVHLPMLTQHG